MCVCGGGGGEQVGCTEEMLARSGVQLHLTVQDAPKERKGRGVCVCVCVCVCGGEGGVSGGGGAVRGRGACIKGMLARSGFQLHLTVRAAPKETRGVGAGGRGVGWPGEWRAAIGWLFARVSNCQTPPDVPSPNCLPASACL